MRRAPAAGLLAIALATAVAGCGPDPDAPGQCAVHTAVSAASAPDRQLLGLGSQYPADPGLAARAEQLRTSQRVRRAVAWEVMARVLAPVAIPGAGTVARATVPRFRTWYDREDITRVFQTLYAGLAPEARAAHAPFSAEALDDAFARNARSADALDTWTADRWQSYLGALRSPESLAGLGGLRRILLSPDAARHIVQSYPAVLRCLDQGVPAAADAPGEAAPQRTREPVSLGPCATQASGPFFVARGATLRAHFEGAEATQLTVVEGANRSTAAARCTATGAAGCTVEGPGLFHVTLQSGARGARGALAVEHAAPQHPSPACLDGVFPPSAATVSLEWRRGDAGWTLPVYDSTGPALARRYAEGHDGAWGPGDSAAEPGPEAVYTVQLPAGVRYRLAAMHIRTRELDRWINVSLWYSDTPDSDFGADRPVSIQSLGAPWTSYKLCVTTDFDEGDPRPDGGFARDLPSLAAALRAVHEGRGGPSWCSNPYIDGGPGLVRSNCVGCHQHAMTGVRPAETVGDEARFPGIGRRQVRDRFVSDQFWGITAGDNLGAVLAETVSWWRSAR